MCSTSRKMPMTNRTAVIAILSIEAVIVVICALALIAFQIVSIVSQARLYFIAVGIWAGALILVAKIGNVLLLIMKSCRFFIIYAVAQLLALAGVIANTVVNIIAEAQCTNRSCREFDFMWQIHVMLALGLFIGVLVTVTFIVILLFKIITKEPVQIQPGLSINTIGLPDDVYITTF